MRGPDSVGAFSLSLTQNGAYQIEIFVGKAMF